MNENQKSSINPIPNVPSQPLFQELTPFQICMKENFPFIENTFQAMDTYSLICEIVGYLNKAIENQNINQKSNQEMYNTLVQFRNYMDNYFTNLDVQEEIDNKLNQMALDGTLNDILNPLVNEKYNQLEAQINLNTSRIDNFTKLSEGSTTGDAELTDLRINFSGVSFSSAGSSVRDTEKYLNNEIQRIENRNNFIHKNILDFTNVAENKAITNKNLVDGNIQLQDSPNIVSFLTPIKLSAGQTAYMYLPFSGAGSIMAFRPSTGVVIFNRAMPNYGEHINKMWKAEYTPTEEVYLFICCQMLSGTYINLAIADTVPLLNQFINSEQTILDNVILQNTNLNPTEKITYITVSPNSEYTTLTSAINYFNNNEYEKGIILLNSGTYDYEKEGNIGLGYQIPSNVDLIGINNPIVSYEASQPQPNSSVIHFPFNNNFENITFLAYNTRYVIHDDNPAVLNPSYVSWKNCIFKHIGSSNDSSIIGTALGCGFGVRHNVKFEGCKFIPYKNPILTSYPFSIHGNPIQGSTWELNGCDLQDGSYKGIRICPWGNDKTLDTLIINNCTFNRILFDKADYTGSINNIQTFIDNDENVAIDINNTLPFNLYNSNTIKKFEFKENVAVNDIINYPEFEQVSYKRNFGTVLYNNEDNNLCIIKVGGYIPSKFIKGGLSKGYVNINNETHQYTGTGMFELSIGYYNGDLKLYN